jgi:hypothetical protein
MISSFYNSLPLQRYEYLFTWQNCNSFFFSTYDMDRRQSDCFWFTGYHIIIIIHKTQAADIFPFRMHRQNKAFASYHARKKKDAKPVFVTS